MRHRIAHLCLALAFTASAQTSSPSRKTSPEAVHFPLTRIVLYKNGIGYFEHAGRVRGNADVNLELTSAQLNDVLKSLTVVDRNQGRITSVTYNSRAPLERRLGTLRLQVGEGPTTVQFLEALRGVRLEVRGGASTVSGRLLSIDQRELPTNDGDKITTHQVSIVSDAGEVRVFDLNPSIHLRIAEKDVNQEIAKYFTLVASTRDQDVRRIALRTAGAGERELRVSYISEVPVWKCTYRILIPKAGKPLLQGWAIVDNTVGEDWKGVELSLIAGAPHSFVQELSQPYYTRRPVVALPENTMITPQTHEATMEEEEEGSGHRLPPSNPASPSLAVAAVQTSEVGVGIGSGSRGASDPVQAGASGPDQLEESAEECSPLARPSLTAPMSTRQSRLLKALRPWPVPRTSEIYSSTN